jgi:hypothetical protein
LEFQNFCIESLHGNGLAKAALSLGLSPVYVPPLPINLPELVGRIQAAVATVISAMLTYSYVWTEHEYRNDIFPATCNALTEHP